MIFFVGLIILLLISLILWLPLGRSIDWQKNYRQQQNIALYQEQIKGNLDPELAQEFAQRLLDDEKQLEKQPHFINAIELPYRKYFLICTLLLMFVPVGYYFSLNRFYDELQHQRQEKQSQPVEQKNESYVEKIQQRLRQNPNNSEDWVELAQAYMRNNEFDNAIVAYSYADRLTDGKPYILGLAANALYQQAGQRITPQVQSLLDSALQQDPKEVSSLSLLAGEAFVKGDYSEAMRLWQKVLDADRTGVERRAVIQSMQMAEMLQKAKNSTY